MLRSVFRAQRAVPVRQLALRGPRFYSEKATESEEASKADTEAQQAEGDFQANPELEALQQKYLQKDQDAAKFKNAYQRAVADFQNLQKSTEVEKKKAKDYALQGFAKDLLSTVDNFDLALKAVPDQALANEEFKGFHEGVKMVQDVFEKTLDRNGLQKINPLGEKFDPKIHEAVFMVAQPDKENNTIFDVQQTGFIYNDRVIRAPKVGVVKNS